jgi:hypothetical protein
MASLVGYEDRRPVRFADLAVQAEAEIKLLVEKIRREIIDSRAISSGIQ